MDSTIEPPAAERKPFRQLVPGLLLTTVIFWIPALLFLKLADEILEGQPLYGDVGILRWLHGLSGPFLDHLMVAITNLGSAPVVVTGVFIAAAILTYKHHRRQALFLLFTAGGTGAINVIFKLLFHRHRPTLWHQIITENGYSFPSGHAMISSALAFSIIVLCWNNRYRLLIVTLSAAFFILVGVSRLYLGVHFPSDVVGGWIVSFLWVVTVHRVFDYFGKRRDTQHKTIKTQPN